MTHKDNQPLNSISHMEIKTPYLANVIFTILGLTILWYTWKLVNWVWWRPRMLEKKLRLQGLEGNSYRLLVGDMKDSALMLKQAKSKPIEFNHDITARVTPFPDYSIKIYGKKSFIWRGPVPMVNIMEPEHIKEVFTKIHEFTKPSLNALNNYLITGLVTYDGSKWAQSRKIINPAFHLEKLKLMMPAFNESVSDLINKWDKLFRTNERTSCELDVRPHIQELSRDAISRTAFGSNYEEGRRIFQLLLELANIIVPVIMSVQIPGWRFLPTKTNLKVKAIDKEIQELLKDMIKKREKAIREGEATNDDLLNLLIKSNMKEIEEQGTNNKSAVMSIQDVIDECKLFYFAGQETTSVLLVWTLILLAKYPDWQTLARQEILKAFGNQKPDFDGLNHLKVVTMILHEVLRLYPPISGVIRMVRKETKLGNLLLPQGVLVKLPTLQMHHDKELWGEDALEFNPHRFSDGVSQATKNQVSFFPFTWGPRICIGMNFALLEAKLALEVMLQKFSFDLSPSYTHAPHNVITLQPQYGAHLTLHKL